MHVEQLIHADWIIPVDADDHVLSQHSLAIDNGLITAVLPTTDANNQIQAQQTITLPDHVLIPGLVNAHTHAAMTLLRGLSDDLPLMTWLQDHIWPAEQRWVTEEFVAAGTRLALLEMLMSGTTCFNDMYFYPEITATVAAELGMRAMVGLIVIDFPTRYAANASAYIEQGRTLYETYRHHPLITTAWAPHAPYTVSDSPLRELATLNAQLTLKVHIHLHETADEITRSQHDHGCRPVARLQKLGLINDQLIAVHMTQLEPDEIAYLATANAGVVHCPESNLKLASGFCPVTELLTAGVPVALGTDGAASNNDLNLLGELRTAALLAKGVSGSAAALPAPAALRMATLTGAQVLGLADRIGSLTPGKAADIVALDLNAVATQPVYHPLSHIVYAAGRHQVRHVWINGQHLLRDGQPTMLNIQTVFNDTRRWRDQIYASDQ
jgi:5-methylthioadenosine/S-adenosylhomocysteine deaminase